MFFVGLKRTNSKRRQSFYSAFVKIGDYRKRLREGKRKRENVRKREREREKERKKERVRERQRM